MAWIRSREIALVILSAAAFLVLAGYYLNIGALTSFSNDVQVWAIVIAAFALGIGAVNLVAFHVHHIAKRTQGQWYLSVLLLIAFAVT